MYLLIHRNNVNILRADSAGSIALVTIALGMALSQIALMIEAGTVSDSGCQGTRALELFGFALSFGPILVKAVSEYKLKRSQLFQITSRTLGLLTLGALGLEASLTLALSLAVPSARTLQVQAISVSGHSVDMPFYFCESSNRTFELLLISPNIMVFVGGVALALFSIRNVTRRFNEVSAITTTVAAFAVLYALNIFLRSTESGSDDPFVSFNARLFINVLVTALIAARWLVQAVLMVASVRYRKFVAKSLRANQREQSMNMSVRLSSRSHLSTGGGSTSMSHGTDSDVFSDWLSTGTTGKLLHDPVTCLFLHKFATSVYSGESVEFFMAVTEFEREWSQRTSGERKTAAHAIIAEFVEAASPKCVNFSGTMQQTLIASVKRGCKRKTFEAGKREVIKLISQNLHRGFVNSAFALQAERVRSWTDGFDSMDFDLQFAVGCSFEMQLAKRGLYIGRSNAHQSIVASPNQQTRSPQLSQRQRDPAPVHASVGARIAMDSEAQPNRLNSPSLGAGETTDSPLPTTQDEEDQLATNHDSATVQGDDARV